VNHPRASWTANPNWLTITYNQIGLLLDRFGLLSTLFKINFVSMNKEDPQLKIRLPKKLKEDIVSFAKTNKRSLNAEIVDLLEKALNLNDNSGIPSNATINKIISLVASRTSKIVERELALDTLSADEKAFLVKLDKLPKSKRDSIIETFISILKLI